MDRREVVRGLLTFTGLAGFGKLAETTAPAVQIHPPRVSSDEADDYRDRSAPLEVCPVEKQHPEVAACLMALLDWLDNADALLVRHELEEGFQCECDFCHDVRGQFYAITVFQSCLSSSVIHSAALRKRENRNRENAERRQAELQEGRAVLPRTLKPDVGRYS